ncbi:MAG: ParB N-terminal domain-containing protein [Cyanobacteria bacterium J06573_2]
MKACGGITAPMLPVKQEVRVVRVKRLACPYFTEQRRLKASEIAGLSKVPVTILDLDDTAAIQVRLIENLQREDLNPLEETEGILELLSLQLKMDSSEAVKLLHKLEHEDKGKIARNVTGSWRN